MSYHVAAMWCGKGTDRALAHKLLQAPHGSHTGLLTPTPNSHKLAVLQCARQYVSCVLHHAVPNCFWNGCNYSNAGRSVTLSTRARTFLLPNGHRHTPLMPQRYDSCGMATLCQRAPPEQPLASHRGSRSWSAAR